MCRCLRIAPGLVSQVWLELNVASTKNPAISCDSIGAMCQALSGHLPTERQQRQLAFFLDLEVRIRLGLTLSRQLHTAHLFRWL